MSDELLKSLQQKVKDAVDQDEKKERVAVLIATLVELEREDEESTWLSEI